LLFQVYDFILIRNKGKSGQIGRRTAKKSERTGGKEMLCANSPKSRAITGAERRENKLYLYSQAGIHRLEPKNGRTVRVTYTEAASFSDWEKPGIVPSKAFEKWTYREDGGEISLQTDFLKIVIDRETASYRYYDEEGSLLLQEREKESKILEEFPVYRLSEEKSVVEEVVTPDGVKEVVKEAAKIPDGVRYHTRLYLEWGDEALFGLGQHEEGFGSLRGQTVYVHQANRKIAVPMLVSTRGYGILMDTYSPMIFQDSEYGSYLYTEADREMDFYFMNGTTMDGVIRQYRQLTGKASLLPKWAFGYIQSQERYETREEIQETVREYRERKIGLDGIVLDWCSWEDGKWGQKTFDSGRFPQPEEMIRKLHEEHVHFMLSVWPNMDESTENYREFKERKLLLPGVNIYNSLCEEGRKLYWEQVQRGLACHGVDAWWCDSSEPFTPEWNHREKPEPSRMYEEYCGMAGLHLPAEQMNAFGLYHARAISEGQRHSSVPSASKKRVFNLTRSGTTGQQRYGTVLWSGDIAATWETLRRQIAAGIHFCASGLPYWTVDIGAFFVKEGDLWYWKGDYPQASEDPGYRELFVRWYQWGAFLPVFRGHGTDCRRELWQFAGREDDFYEALLLANRLRYELMPYIYSLAGISWLKDCSMIRHLAFGFPQDKQTWEIKDQYLFGEGLMVCPVTEPFYYGKNSVRLSGKSKTRKVYLPKGYRWYDYWTDKVYEGGQWIEAEAALLHIPLFVREGTILPMTEFAPSTEEQKPALTVVVYPGKDSSFVLYEDEGDGFGYETGEYCLTTLRWQEEQGELFVEKTKECNGVSKRYEIKKYRTVGKDHQSHCFP